MAKDKQPNATGSHKARQPERDGIADQVAAFLASGKKIDVLADNPKPADKFPVGGYV